MQSNRDYETQILNLEIKISGLEGQIKVLEERQEMLVETNNGLGEEIADLEKENQELKKPKFDLSLLDNAKKIEVDYNEELLEKIKILEKENQKLKEEILEHKRARTYQAQCILKLEKAIEILKKHYTLKPMIWCGKPTIHITYNWDEFEEFEVITQQEFELLREVLGE